MQDATTTLAALFERPPLTAHSAQEARTLAEADHTRHLGRQLTVDEVSVFVNCPTHPDAGLFGPVCGCLHRLGITDPCTPHELTGPDGALVVEVIAGEDVATSGWDGGVLYPYWDVTIVSDEPLVLVHPDQRTTDVPRDWVHTAWIGLPGIGLPGIGLPDEDDANRD